MITGLSYSASTPNLYKGQKHGVVGWSIFALAIGLSSAQIIRASVILLMKRDSGVTIGTRIKHLLRSGTSCSAGFTGEYELVVHDVQYEDEGGNFHNQPMSRRTMVDDEEDLQRRAVVGQQKHVSKQQQESSSPTERHPRQFWRRPHRQKIISLDLYRHEGYGMGLRTLRTHSYGGESSRTASSDETLHERNGDEHLMPSPGELTPPFPHQQREGRYTRAADQQVLTRGSLSRADAARDVLKYGEIFLWRIMVLLGWTAFLTECIIYWGGCRAPYIVGVKTPEMNARVG